MKIGDNVRLAIDAMDHEPRELELAMMLACAAVDGTARRTYPSVKSSKERFIKLIRDNYWLIEPLAKLGVNLIEHGGRTSLILDSPPPQTSPRCCTCSIAATTCTATRTSATRSRKPSNWPMATICPDGAPAGTPWPCRTDCPSPLRHAPSCRPRTSPRPCPFFSLDGHEFLINDWWGRADDFRPIADRVNQVRVKLELGEDW